MPQSRDLQWQQLRLRKPLQSQFRRREFGTWRELGKQQIYFERKETISVCRTARRNRYDFDHSYSRFVSGCRYVNSTDHTSGGAVSCLPAVEPCRMRLIRKYSVHLTLVKYEQRGVATVTSKVQTGEEVAPTATGTNPESNPVFPEVVFWRREQGVPKALYVQSAWSATGAPILTVLQK